MAFKRSRLGRSRSTRSTRSGGTRASLKKSSALVGTYLLAFVRLCQLIAAIVVVGYYGSEVGKAQQNRAVKYNGTSFLYAVVVAAMAAITALFFMIVSFFGEFFAISVLFIWEWMLVLLWAAVTGIMGNKYFKSKPSGGANEWQSMRIAAGFDCASLILWFLTAAIGTAEFFMSGGTRRMRFRGRSDV